MPTGQLLASERPRMPLTIVAGDAATGKTSLVRHLATHSSACRVAAMVTSDARIDASLIARHEGSRIMLHNGGMWVAAEDHGAASLATLVEGLVRPDHVVFDCKPSADLRRVNGYGYMPGYRLNGLVYVTDPLRVQTASTDSAANWQLQ